MRQTQPDQLGETTFRPACPLEAGREFGGYFVRSTVTSLSPAVANLGR